MLPATAADLLEEFPDEHSADLLEGLKPAEAALVVAQLRPDDQVDVLSEFSSTDAEAIIANLPSEDARDVRALIDFDDDVAGGLMQRAKRRLSWLSVNIILNVAAASVIAAYEDTLSAAIALAVFLPIVSDMSGCSGNHAEHTRAVIGRRTAQRSAPCLASRGEGRDYERPRPRNFIRYRRVRLERQCFSRNCRRDRISGKHLGDH
jgi:Mg/Co/Ni transporter MgtE